MLYHRKKACCKKKMMYMGQKDLKKNKDFFHMPSYLHFHLTFKVIFFYIVLFTATLLPISKTTI